MYICMYVKYQGPRLPRLLPTALSSEAEFAQEGQIQSAFLCKKEVLSPEFNINSIVQYNENITKVSRIITLIAAH